MKKINKITAAAVVAASVMAVSPAYAAGWQQNNTGWWYATNADNTNWYSSGWQWIDGNGDGIAECYYFDANGYMLANTTTPDGYMVDANGGWIQNGSLQTKSAAGLGASGQGGSSVIIAYNSSSSGTVTIHSGSGSSSSSKSDEYEEKDFSNYARECFDLINKERVANGLDELEWDDTIAEACDIRAQELPEKFSHSRPDGELCFTVFDEVGIELSGKAENIAEGYSTPKAAVNAWMNSAGHKANILSKSMKRAAIGFYYDASSDYKYYWVQLFGRKRNE